MAIAGSGIAATAASAASAPFASDGTHDVVLFKDGDFALRYAHQTFVPVLLYAAERDRFRKDDT